MRALRTWIIFRLCSKLVDARLVTFDRGLAEVTARTVEVVVPPAASPVTGVEPGAQ